MAIKKLKGQNFRILTGSALNSIAAIPEATNCQVTIQGNMEDGTTKDSEGGWVEEQMTSKQWSVSVDDVDASVASLRALLTEFNSDDGLFVGFDQTAATSGTQNRTPANNELARSGRAILNDISITADNRSTIQIATQFQGNGALS